MPKPQTDSNGYRDRRSAIVAPMIAAHAVKKTASAAMRMNIVLVTITPRLPVANARRFDPVPSPRRLFEWVRHLGDVGGDAPGLDACEHVRGRLPAGLVLKVNAGSHFIRRYLN